MDEYTHAKCTSTISQSPPSPHTHSLAHLRLYRLPKPNLPHALPENRLITTVPEEFVAPRSRRGVNPEAARQQHNVKSLAASKYAFEIKNSNKMHEAFPTDDTFFVMPVLSETSERAHHMFSILAWFTHTHSGSAIPPGLGFRIRCIGLRV